MTQIQSVKDFTVLKEMLRGKRETKENRLLNFYSLMQSFCCDEGNLQHVMPIYRECALTEEDIRSHYDWLDIIAHNSASPDMNAKEFIERVMLMK